MRLIDADELLNDPYFQDETIPERELFIKAVEDSETVDSVPVVRCKDCKKSSYDEDYGNRWCNRNWGCVLVKDDDFCSYGAKV